MTRPPLPDQRSDAEPPGLPGFRTWRGVYLFVFGWFVLVVILLDGVHPDLLVNVADWVVLLGTIVRHRRVRFVAHAQRPEPQHVPAAAAQSTGWGTIGLSVMATQASAITFLSIPGQGFESGIGFVQNYFGLPLALIIVCAVFSAHVPAARRVHRLRVLWAGASTGRPACSAPACSCCSAASPRAVTIYAPAIILSTVLGWRLDLIIVFTGLLVIVYTVTGGSEAVSLTQKWQMAVIFARHGDGLASCCWSSCPTGLGFNGAAHVAGALGKLQAVDLSLDPSRRYTLWTGLLGGLFLSLSYFGTDQSQVQRYIGGASLREGRLGLMFNALLKIPMQFLILLARRASCSSSTSSTPSAGVLQPGRMAASRARRKAAHSPPSRRGMPPRSPQSQTAIRAWPRARTSRMTPRAKSTRPRRHARGQPPGRRSSRRGQSRAPGGRSARQDDRTPTTSSSRSSWPSFRTVRSACSSR